MMTDEKITHVYAPKWLMPVIDFVLVMLAFLIAYVVRYELQILRPVFELNRANIEPYIPYALIYAAWLYLIYSGSGLYKSVRGRSWLEEVYTIINGATNATVLLLGLYFLLQPLVFSRLMLVYVAIFTVILLALARAVQRVVQGYLRSKGVGIQRVLIVGLEEVGQTVLRTMIARPQLGYRPVGYLDDDPERGEVDLGRVKGLGTVDKLAQTLEKEQFDLVVITLSWEKHARILELVNLCQNTGIEVRIVPDVFQLNMRQVQVENLDGIPLLGVHGQVNFKGSNRFLKRVIDILLITLAAPLALLIFGLIAVAIRLEGAGPILYKQRRIGENGKAFNIIKFRSMIPDADKYRQELIATQELDPRHPKLKNDPRITIVGRFLRRTSLDELPNLINVLRGQMSLVGPRPPTPDEVALYEPWHMQRLQIMPGMTGLWQINGRSEVPFEEMCLLDIYYIENWSIKLDAQILLMTLPRVLLRHGAY